MPSWGRRLPASTRLFLEELIKAALEAADPFQAVVSALSLDGETVRVHQQEIALLPSSKVIVVGAGKAGAPMASAVYHLLGNRIEAGWVNVKHGYTLEEEGGHPPVEDVIRIHQAGHPVPDEAGQCGAQRLLNLVSGLTENDLVICLLSGGGSALLPLPAEGITLAEKQNVTQALLASGATINQLNTVRKHISRIKGGQLARAAHPARVVSLILSDVVGSPLDVIASGPTVADSSSFEDAWRIMEHYGLLSHAPASIRERLEAGRAGEIPDTPKPGDSIFTRVHNVIIGDNAASAVAAAERARQLGFQVAVISTFIEGEAREVGKVIAGLAKEVASHGRPLGKPSCLILGGETTVTLHGDGDGGRNQELALSAALALEGWEGVSVLALATDGTDGPTDAAGALATGQTVSIARGMGLEPADFLARNDSYHFFAALNDLLLLGPTNTNVNDLIFIVVN